MEGNKNVNQDIKENTESTASLVFGNHENIADTTTENNKVADELLAIEVATIEKTLTLASLSPADQAAVGEFVKQINIEDTAAVTEYGSAAQKRIAATSDTMLQQTKTKDLGVVGDDLLRLMDEIDGFTPDEGGFFKKLFNAGKQSIKDMTKSYEKVEVTIDSIVGNLNGHKLALYKDIAMLDELYNANLDYFNELNLYIVAGEEKLKLVEANDIPARRKIAEEGTDEMEMQRLNDLIQASNRFDKKIHDLKLTRNISIQMAPQIRMIQNNDQILAEKIQSSITNAIPLWKNQMVISLGLANAKSALDAQQKVTQMTNEMLIKNSELLKQGTIEVAEAAEAGIVSIETVKTTNENLISTIQEVMNIQKEGTIARKAAEVELNKIEGELKQALLEANS